MSFNNLTTIHAPARFPFDDGYQARLIPLIVERLAGPKLPSMTFGPGMQMFGGRLPSHSGTRIAYTGAIANGRTAIIAAWREAA